MRIQRVKYRDIEEIPQLKINKNFKQDFYGSAPSPFIGRFDYPNVNIGILSPQILGDTSYYDSPSSWSRDNTAIGEVASMRYGLVNSRKKWAIKNQPGRFLDIVQEVGMAYKPAELEVKLKKPPKLDFKAEKEIIPFGPGSEILTSRITTNTKIHQHVDKVVADTDLKAVSAISALYKKGFEENHLTKLISVGTLGIKKNRKLVPTRWSITAVDDMLGKEAIKGVKNFPVGEYTVHFGGGWGNYYLILFFPQVWSYELFETYLHKKVNPWSKQGYMYSTDHESYNGRKNYADETAGGYYASRLPVLEHMKNMRRQYSALALRFITHEYNVPLGVWICREATRKSLQSTPLSFNTEEEMFMFAKTLIKNKFGFDLDLLLKESKLLTEKRTQMRLMEF